MFIGLEDQVKDIENIERDWEEIVFIPMPGDGKHWRKKRAKLKGNCCDLIEFFERELLWSDWIVQLNNSEANFGSDVRFDIWDEQVSA